MKRIICALLALLLVFGCVFALTGCDGGKKEAETPKKPVIPTGYQEYKNEAISFAYPEGWEKQEGSTTLLQEKATGNNITVAYEAKTDEYEKMTVDEFNKTLKPVLEAAGLSVSNVSIKKEKTNNLDLVKMAFNTTAMGVSMKQTILVATVGDRTYSVTVTEVKSDSALLSNVVKTLYALD